MRSALCEASLQVKRKSSPLSKSLSTTLWQAKRSSPRYAGRSGFRRAPCFMSQRLTALRSQSCFSAPSV